MPRGKIVQLWVKQGKSSRQWQVVSVLEASRNANCLGWELQRCAAALHVHVHVHTFT